MKQLFLRAKHWQLFVFSIGLPFLMLIITAFTIAGIVFNHPNNSPDPEDFSALFIIIPIIIVIGNFIQFYWMWSVGIELQKYQAPQTRKLTTKRFKFFAIVPIIYMAFFAIFMGSLFHTMISSTYPNFIAIGLTFVFVFILHFLSIFAIIFSFYFVAKTIKSVEMKKEAHFSDYIGDFFLIWFFPVGVWFIQPRVNKIIQQESGNSENEELLD